MAEQFSMPSMFDTRYAMDRQIELDAQKQGAALGGGKRGGMYYAASLNGDVENANLMKLAGMFGGGDPRIQKQNAIDNIKQQFPSPETAEDFKAISNALNAQGLYEEADRAMSMANDIISSTPVRTKTLQNGIYYYDDTGLPVVTGATQDYDSDPKKAAFQIYTQSQAFKDSTTKSDDILAWNKDWDDKNPSGGGDDYASKITGIMASINGDTTIGGDLYDPQFPNGRKFTRLEAETKFEENKRETSEQKIDVQTQLSNFEFTNETVISASADSQQSYKDLESFNNILQAYEQGATTGKLEKTFLSTKGLLRTLGYEGDINATMSQEILLAEFEKLALGRMENLSGSASDNDIAFVQAGGPSFDKTPEANILLIRQAMEMSQEAQKKAAFVRSYVANYKTSGGKEGTPSSWELTSAIEAFKNRGDYSESAQARYGDIWKRADFINAQGTREELIKKNGLNQLNTWERYDKMKAGDITLGNITEKYESNAAKSRRFLAEDLGDD
tara:strand:+ start:1099 stop:2607 length:1509 start_codon:yes stop_codon:yes gene_type:complete